VAECSLHFVQFANLSEPVAIETMVGYKTGDEPRRALSQSALTTVCPVACSNCDTSARWAAAIPPALMTLTSSPDAVPAKRTRVEAISAASRDLNRNARMTQYLGAAPSRHQFLILDLSEGRCSGLIAA
jgi:hypothetical protein